MASVMLAVAKNARQTCAVIRSPAMALEKNSNKRNGTCVAGDKMEMSWYLLLLRT